MRFEEALSKCRSDIGIAMTHERWLSGSTFLAWGIIGAALNQYIFKNHTSEREGIVSTLRILLSANRLTCFEPCDLKTEEFLGDGWRLIDVQTGEVIQ